MPAGRPAPAGHRSPPAPTNAAIVDREDASSTIVRLRVRPDAGVPSFAPGQYLALGVPVEGRPLLRPYSTASPRGEDQGLDFLIRLVPDGALTPRLWTMRAGDRVRLGTPKGLFVDDRSDSRRRLFVATGTGIAPLLSMLETRLRESPDGPARRRPIVVHGVAYATDLVAHGRLAALARARRIRYLPVVSRPAAPANAGWRGATGHVDARLADVFAIEAVDPGALLAFVCGGPGLVSSAAAALARLGVPDEAVRSEAYWSPAPLVNDDAARLREGGAARATPASA